MTLIPPLTVEACDIHPRYFSLSPSVLVTHSNRIAASARNFLSKSQRKKRSRLQEEDGSRRGAGRPRRESEPAWGRGRGAGRPRRASGTSLGGSLGQVGAP